MHITILVAGSRGAVQPLVALGLGLQQAGHQVCVATHDTFREFITEEGLDFAPVGGDPRELVKQQMEPSSRPPPIRLTRRLVRLARPSLEPFWEQFLSGAWRACQGTQAIVYNPLGMMAGYHIAEKLGVPCYMASQQPWSRTRAFPSMYAPAGLHLGGAYNWLTHYLVDRLLWGTFHRPVNRWRQETLHLPPLSTAAPYRQLNGWPLPFLYGYSPAVIPKPPDWPAWLYVTGYWFLDRNPGWQPPANLVDFLAAGPPPIYVGFGSMINHEQDTLVERAVAALTRTGQRGILLTGWGGRCNLRLPDQVFEIESIPHDWLFLRVAAVVHHGGSGTTAAGLRAGVPSLVIPFFGDQPFWGQRVADLGVGPPFIPLKRLTVKRLAAALRAMTTDTAMQTRAAALGRAIRAEDGVTRAVEIFHQHLP